MSGILKILFVLAPLVGQGIIQVQDSMGVHHGTIAGSIAQWLIALTLTGRALANQDNKNVKGVQRGDQYQDPGT